MTPREQAVELVDKMGIEKVALTTSVTIRPETTYYGWVNGQYAKQCALILVNEMLDMSKVMGCKNCCPNAEYWQDVKTEIESL